MISDQALDSKISIWRKIHKSVTKKHPPDCLTKHSNTVLYRFQSISFDERHKSVTIKKHTKKPLPYGVLKYSFVHFSLLKNDLTPAVPQLTEFHLLREKYDVCINPKVRKRNE